MCWTTTNLLKLLLAKQDWFYPCTTYWHQTSFGLQPDCCTVIVLRLDSVPSDATVLQSRNCNTGTWCMRHWQWVLKISRNIWKTTRPSPQMATSSAKSLCWHRNPSPSWTLSSDVNRLSGVETANRQHSTERKPSSSQSVTSARSVRSLDSFNMHGS